MRFLVYLLFVCLIVSMFVSCEDASNGDSFPKPTYPIHLKYSIYGDSQRTCGECYYNLSFSPNSLANEAVITNFLASRMLKNQCTSANNFACASQGISSRYTHDIQLYENGTWDNYTINPDPVVPGPVKKSFTVVLNVTNRGLPASSVNWKYDVSNQQVFETVAGISRSWEFDSSSSGYFVEKIGKAPNGQTPDAYIGFKGLSSNVYGTFYILIFSSKTGGLLYEMSIEPKSGYQSYWFEHILKFAIDWIKTYPENSYSGSKVIEFYE